MRASVFGFQPVSFAGTGDAVSVKTAGNPRHSVGYLREELWSLAVKCLLKQGFDGVNGWKRETRMQRGSRGLSTAGLVACFYLPWRNNGPKF